MLERFSSRSTVCPMRREFFCVRLHYTLYLFLLAMRKGCSGHFEPWGQESRIFLFPEMGRLWLLRPEQGIVEDHFSRVAHRAGCHGYFANCVAVIYHAMHQLLIDVQIDLIALRGHSQQIESI